MHKIPSLSQAQQMISEAEQRNPGAWVQHSVYVAQAAELIAARLPGMDPQAAYIMGLLHDIGRREGVHGLRHSLDGYVYLNQLGYEDAARICITHSFPIPKIESIFGEWDCTSAETYFLRGYIDGIVYSDYDRLIQLCDSLALPSGFCLLEKRLVDVLMRYGSNDYVVPKWRAYMETFDRYEAIIGASIYSLLPGVVENTFSRYSNQSKSAVPFPLEYIPR